MQADDSDARGSIAATTSAKQIASWWHLNGFLLISAGIAAWGVHTQYAGMGAASAAASGQVGGHGQAMRFYLTAILGDAALLYYCWFGVHQYGGTLETLTGGRWSSWTAIGIDIAVALPFWLVWEGAAYGVVWLLGPSNAKSVSDLLPRSVAEVLAWIVVSITAGFCEEIIFRGYLQKQFQALAGSVAIAVLAQALVFGLAHCYQGWKQVTVISFLGMLYGVLAAWRKNLRANVIAHAWSDVWEGWLKILIFR